MNNQKTTIGRRILSLLIVATMIFTIQGILVWAETVDATERILERAGTMPTNPVHHCAKDDTDWSYVYFGSYPQTEVTGTALTSAITNVDYDTNGDAWVNGMKYRRISKSDTNYDSHFGNSTYRYFKWERIKWRVMQNNGSTLFVVADQALDCKTYNEADTSITWEDCMLRAWLNETFYNTAFSSREQEEIVLQTVVNDDNLENEIEGGNDTQDNVYLLSIAEVENLEYGFCESYGTESASRWMQPSDYAYAMGVHTDSSSSTGRNDNCCWWLRSPGCDMSCAAHVMFYGDVYRDGGYADSHYRGCVPVLYINLSSDLWITIDDGTSGDWEEVAFYMLKKQGKEELDFYKDTADYREAQRKELAAAIAAGKAAIEAAEDEEAVQRALTAAKAAIDQIKTDEQLVLEEQKNAGGSTKSELMEKIVSKATSIKGKIQAKSKGFLVKWKTEASVTGYQIQYSTSRKFTKKTTKMKTVKKAFQKKLTVKKLKALKKYYVRIRTYKTVDGKKYYSPWSKEKSVKTKK